MEQFKITRIYTDVSGESHFEDIWIPLTDKGLIGYLSGQVPVKDMIFRKVEEQYDYNFHNAPTRQYIALLDGGIEIETSDGEIRTFSAGEVLLVEDTTGKGHRSRNIQRAIRSSLFILLS